MRRSLIGLGGPTGAWLEYAACTRVDPCIFFSESKKLQARAIQVCESCPVTEQCLEDAIVKNEMYGIRGGKTERERRMILAKRRFKKG